MNPESYRGQAPAGSPASPPPDRLETLSSISRALSSTLDLRALCETIDREIACVMDATLFSIATVSDDEETLWLPYVREQDRVFQDQRLPFGGNVTSVVIREGDALLFSDHTEYALYAGKHGLPVVNVGEDQGEAVMFVPLHTGSRCVGVISVESLRRGVYSSDDLDTLTIIAAQAAVAIENAELFARSQQQVRQMSALLRVAQAVNGSLDLADVLDAILVSMQEVVPYAFAAILLPDEASGILEVVDSMGPLSRLDRSSPPHPGFRVPFGQGISGSVYRSGHPLVVPDVRAFPGFIDHELPGVLSEMAVPLQWDQQVVGVLDIGREGTNAFHRDEIDLASLFASHAAVALRNARLYAEQRRRVEELQVLERIVQHLQGVHDPVAIAQLMADHLGHLIEYQTCRLYTMDLDGHRLHPIRVEGGTTTSDLPIDRGFAGWIAREARADRIDNAREDPRPAHISGTDRVEESMVGAPLIYEGRVQGVITLSCRGRNRFDDNDLRLLQIVAAQLAIAFDRARLYGALHQEARTDSLVRLWNRRHLLERFWEERARAARSGRSLTAVMVDIDRFKRVNDTYGHDAGDLVLREVAAVLRQNVRAEDVLARYGGEEFAALLIDCRLEHALAMAGRIRASIAAHRFPPEAGIEGLTVSVGVAEWRREDTGEELFSRADTAMYRAKESGGNSVRRFEG